MIIATIGNYDYALSSLEDAHTLLEVIARAQRVNYNYNLPRETRWHVHAMPEKIEVKVLAGPLLTQEEADRLVAQAFEKAAESA